MAYRKYTIEVTVEIHESVEADRDRGLLDALDTDIKDLVSGDVVMIKTRRR